MPTTYNEGQEEGNKYKEVSKLTVKPFENEDWQSYLTFTIKGKDFTWFMPNYVLLTIIEDYFSQTPPIKEPREYIRILK